MGEPGGQASSAVLSLSTGEQWAPGEGCSARSVCGGAGLVLRDLGESLMDSAPECWHGWQVWKAVPQEGNGDHQEGVKVEDGSLNFCLGRCA